MGKFKWGAYAAASLSLNLTNLDMDALYENIVRQIAGGAIATPQGESLKEAVEHA